MHGDWNNDMNGGFAWGFVPMALMMMLVWGSVIWFGLALLRRGGDQQSEAGDPCSSPSPQQILAERLARGEIEPDDYRTRLEALTTTARSGQPAHRP